MKVQLKATLPRSKRLQTIVFLSKILHKALNTLLNLKTSKWQTQCIRTLVGAPLKMFGVFAVLRKFTASPKVKKCKSLKRGLHFDCSYDSEMPQVFDEA